MYSLVPFSLVLPLILLFVLSLWDDIRGLPVAFRFFLHFVAAIWFVFGCGLFTSVGIIALSFTILAIVWSINLYNFMDGSDGLAGGMALFGFSIYGVAALMGGDSALAMICFSVGAATLAFLYFNFAPAKIFMGDAGSIPLGFLVSAIGILGWNRTLWPFWFPVMVFSPFVVDATVTLIKRFARGQKIWQAHREHYYQKLVQIGVGHRNTALLEYLIMFAVGLSALCAMRAQEITHLIIATWTVMYFLALGYLDYRWGQRKHD